MKWGTKWICRARFLANGDCAASSSSSMPQRRRRKRETEKERERDGGSFFSPFLSVRPAAESQMRPDRGAITYMFLT